MRIFGSPSRYIQGPSALELLPECVENLGGGRPFLILDPMVSEVVPKYLPESAIHIFDGDVTGKAIASTAEQARDAAVRCVIGCGGGKAIDFAKGVSLQLNLPLIVVPTVASNDGAPTRAIVIFDERRVITEVRMLPRNPEIVLVDTSIIARAPARFLAAGMGDALSKVFEVTACKETGGKTSFGALTSHTALSLANACHQTIRERGLAALSACEVGHPNEALEDVVEASILMSGLSFESGGLSIGHALAHGLTVVPQAAEFLHGEHVAYASLVQMAHEKKSMREIIDLKNFMISVGLPVSLADLKVGRTELSQVVRASLATHFARNSVFPATYESLMDAVSLNEASY